MEEIEYLRESRLIAIETLLTHTYNVVLKLAGADEAVITEVEADAMRQASINTMEGGDQPDGCPEGPPFLRSRSLSWAAFRDFALNAGNLTPRPILKGESLKLSKSFISFWSISITSQFPSS